MPPYDAGRDLRILRAMADQFEPYLITDDLFWPLSGRVPGGMPRLTIGGMLLRRHRLRAFRPTLSPDQQAQLDDALAAIQAQQDEWRLHYHQKISRDWEMRRQLLEEFLRDCDEADARDCFENWPSQARQRTMLHLLTEEAATRDLLTDEQQRALHHLDTNLRRYLMTGEAGQFLWSAPLADVYPRDPFWWLWVVPHEAAAKH